MRNTHQCIGLVAMLVILLAAGTTLAFKGHGHHGGKHHGDPVSRLLSHKAELTLTDDQVLPQTEVLSIAPLLGEAIKRIHRNESVSRLFR